MSEKKKTIGVPFKGTKRTFGRCGQCGQTVYIDGFGDDVIPTGYYNQEEGCFECEGCYHPEESEEQNE